MAFKGGRTGLRLVIPATVDFERACLELRATLAGAGDFFRGAEVTLDSVPSSYGPGEIEILRSILQDKGLKIVEAGPQDPAGGVSTAETMTVRTPVRTGQRIEAEGTLLVLADVHAGAEILAGRDVIVMGSARGAIAAGLSSGREAQVFAFELRPTMLRLGDLVAVAPTNNEPGRGEIARVRDGRIAIEPFSGWQLRMKRSRKI